MSMIGGSVFGQQIRRSIPGVVRMRESKVNHKRACVALGGSCLQVVNDTVAVPGAASIRSGAAFGGFMPDLKLYVGGFVTVANLASSHRGIASTIEDGRQSILINVRRTEQFSFWSIR